MHCEARLIDLTLLENHQRSPEFNVVVGRAQQRFEIQHNEIKLVALFLIARILFVPEERRYEIEKVEVLAEH